MRTVFRDVQVMVMDARRSVHPRATVVVDDQQISAVLPGDPPELAIADADRVIDGRGHLLMPGLVNAHFHSSVNHRKGSLDSLPLEVFMLFESPSAAERATPREAYVRTMLGALEMLKSGVTSVMDDAFFVPAPSPAVIDAVMQAYADSGIRATLALDQPEVPEADKLPFLRELLPPDLRARAEAAPAMDAAGLLACYDHLLSTWHGRADGRLRAAVSCSAPQRVSLPYFHALDALSRRHDLPFYVHVLETKLQRVLGDEHLAGRSLVRYMHDEGLLSERSHIIHGVWLDDADLALIAGAGAVVAHNPISNLRLGSGIMPFRAMRRHGILICLGTDEAIADDAINMWAVAKQAALIHNLSTVDYLDWPRAAEILDCLITGGARALRSPQALGQIAAGQLADLVLLDLDTLAFTPLNNLERQLVHCENGSSVRLTMVAGRIVHEHGRVVTVDEAALRAEARRMFSPAQGPAGGGDADAQRWLPYYRDMYLRAAACDVGLRRCAGDRDG